MRIDREIGNMEELCGMNLKKHMRKIKKMTI